ncbi:MAG: extracellular solute-binding protein [Egibacteraceae bacterium]
MLRRSWRTALILLVLVLAAAACGGDGENEGSGEDLPGADLGGGTENAAASTENGGGGGGAADGEAVNISIIENAVRGGKNAATAAWLLEDVIPAFEQRMADEGQNVTVELVEGGTGDDDYKTRLALDLRVGEGADIMGFDQFWLSEFNAAGYLAPLEEIVGPQVSDWEGWDAIPEAVQGSLVLEDQRYGIPFGTDGRVLFFRKDVFEQAGLPTDWQPESWQDILEAGRTIQQAMPDVVPLQFNAGQSMGEATTLQGFVPILLGTGVELYEGQWQGNTEGLQQALGFFDTVYSEGLGDADLQLRGDARDRTFEMFANGQIGVLAESDYLWRSVIAPEEGLFPVQNRDEVIGYAKIPAMEPGAGIRDEDFVSASGGTGRVMNPNTQHPEIAWEFLKELGSQEAVQAFVEREPRITARTDVNEQALEGQPMLSFVAEEVLPVTWYRPGFQEYPQVSEVIQQTVEDVVADRSAVDAAAQAYEQALIEIVGQENVGGGQ